MAIKRLPLPAAAGAALLFACSTSPTGPESPDEGYFQEAEYSIVGDRIITLGGPDTVWSCADTGKTMNIRPERPDTNRFTLSGNIFRVFTGLDTVWAASPDSPPEAVVDKYSEFARLGGGQGLEGRWRFQGYGYSLLSGNLSAEARENLDYFQKRFLIRSRYVTEDYDFSDDRIYMRVGGDFAGLYVAEWNGAFLFDSTQPADSAEYDVEVARLDSGTVRLKGRRTGETVTLTREEPRPGWTYSSDNPAHPAYSGNPATRPCDALQWFRTEFLAGNRRAGQVFKQGARPGPFADWNLPGHHGNW